jgi:hypothetical protein
MNFAKGKELGPDPDGAGAVCGWAYGSSGARSLCRENCACVVPDVLPRGQNVSGAEAVLRVGLSLRGVEEQRPNTRLKRFLVWD